MKINIISIGHKPPTWAEEGCKEYLKRFQPDLSIVLTELKPALRVSDTDKNNLARAKEKGRILRSEEHTSELQSRSDLVCRLLLEKKNKKKKKKNIKTDFNGNEGFSRNNA